MNSFAWWQGAVVYQIYPRSFMDSNQDGIGDLQGMIDRLDYFNDMTENSLGIDAIWISPFYPSPMKDFGYDVSDYTDVDPMFGDLARFDKLVEEAHKRNIKIIIDYVPNHTSDQHKWFIESNGSRNNPKHDWYIWRDAKPDGSLPNNWGSMFGGPAWAWNEKRQQYYFHQFVPEQPDLNWRNPAVREAMFNVLRFWLKRGVDGFRMDVVNMIWKHLDMPDQPIIEGTIGRGKNDIHGQQKQIYSHTYDGVHTVMKQLRNVLNEFGERVMIGEIWVPLEERMKFHGENGNEFHMPFNFDFITLGDHRNTQMWQAATYRELVEAYEAGLPAGGWPNYVMGNHDIPRLASRLGSEARARLAGLMLLTLRGTPTIYMGEEIGMVNGDIKPEQLQDPQGINLGVEHTRDICRTPFQWDSSAFAGFSNVETWLPVNADYEERNVLKQKDLENSILSLYQKLIWYRKQHNSLAIGSYQTIEAPQGIYAYLREYADERHLIALNFTDKAHSMSLSEHGKIILNTAMNRSETVSDTLSLAADEGVLIRLLD
jgi:alpha-glucosidase